MNIIGIVAAVYFIPGICYLVYLGFKKDEDAVAKAVRWPVDLYHLVK